MLLLDHHRNTSLHETPIKHSPSESLNSTNEDLFLSDDENFNYENDRMWEAYTYKEGDRGDYNVDKSLSNSHVDDQLEELRNENKQLKIENETLIKENTELKLQIEKLQKNNKEINK